MNVVLTRLAIPLVLLILWQLAAWAAGGHSYILPGPLSVAEAWIAHWDLLLRQAATTVFEILAGLLLGAAFGMASALGMAASPRLRGLMLPVLVASQAVPVFALAPVLVLWLGYGLASKIAMAVIVIYFPVSAAFLDGLRRTDPGWIELARTMNARDSAASAAARRAAGAGLRLARGDRGGADRRRHRRMGRLKRGARLHDVAGQCAHADPADVRRPAHARRVRRSALPRRRCATAPARSLADRITAE